MRLQQHSTTSVVLPHLLEVSSWHSSGAARNSTEAWALPLTYSVTDCDLWADVRPLPLCCFQTVLSQQWKENESTI